MVLRGALLPVGTLVAVYSSQMAAAEAAPFVAAEPLAEMQLHLPSPAIVAKFGASCLDGTPPYMYVRTNASSTKWVLFLEGGGW